MIRCTGSPVRVVSRPLLRSSPIQNLRTKRGGNYPDAGGAPHERAFALHRLSDTAVPGSSPIERSGILKNKIKGGLVVVGLIAPIVGTGIGPTCGYAFAQAVFATETQMRVSRHESVASISLAQHATNFAQASTALQGDSGSNDIALNLTLTNRTPMYIVTGGAAIPDTPAEYAAMQWNSTNSYMTVVNQLDWCGFIGAWGGCGHPEGMLQGFLLTRALVVSDKGGIALAHEFGHTLGNSHDNTGNMIMDPDLLTVNDTKCGTVTTCDKFRKYFPTVCNTGTGHSKPVICSPTVTTFAPQQPPALASVGAGILDDESDFSEVPIEELAKNIIVDQMPHQAEFFYGQDDVAVLRAMLEEADFAPTRRTIVTLIGLISDGSSEDVFAIQDHLSTEDAEVHASMFALGYIVNPCVFG